MKHEISTKWFTNPNQGQSRNSRHEYLICYESEDSCTHEMNIHPPNYVDY